MPATSTTHVCLVLDRSASMQAVREDALGGVNSYIQTANQDRALYEARFSLITFSSESVDTIRKNEIMETVKPIGSDEYRCSGWTPLYDAIGRGIGILDEALEGKLGKAILVVMTDGMENASKEFSHAKITDQGTPGVWLDGPLPGRRPRRRQARHGDGGDGHQRRRLCWRQGIARRRPRRGHGHLPLRRIGR
jgi:hypothetical protein